MRTPLVIAAALLASTPLAAADEPAAKVEPDHELVWLHPHTALNELRHDAHAWAVAVWLRRRT